MNLRNADHLCLYLPGTVLPKPTYDHVVSRFISKVSKKIASTPLGQPGLFTSGIDVEFIPFYDERCPKSCKHFIPFFEYCTLDINNWLYAQWSGDVGQTAWKTTAQKMKVEIDKIINARKDPSKPFVIDIVAHSHGGQIARYLAEAYKDQPHIQFNIVTIETPLSIIPPIIMPENVKMWLHFFHKEDSMQRLGTFLMQAENLMGNESLASPITLIAFLSLFDQWYNNIYTRRIEDVYREKDETETPPPGHQSIELTMPIKDKHNDPINDPVCAGFICQKAIEGSEALAQPASAPAHSPGSSPGSR